MLPKPRRIVRAAAGLLVIDVQERLLPAMEEPGSLLQQIVKLVRGAQALELPVFLTEQYPRGLGRTVPELARVLAGVAPVEKTAFSAWTGGLAEALADAGVSELILCGIEAHVCVAQTALDLLDAGLRPFVVAEAVASRTAANHRLGLDRVQHAGATIVSLEAVLFELLERAGTPEFKAIQALVK